MRVTPAVRALAIWLVVAAGLAVALLVAGTQHSGLDDPNPTAQRPGFLDSVGSRSPAPGVTGSIPAPGRAAVVFFVRAAQQKPLLAELARPGAVPIGVDTAVVGGPVNLAEGPVASVTDEDGSLARGYEMPVPRDHGYPVGYAIVGPDGTVRYRTLDPGVVHRLAEVRTMLRALP
ncbi:MAG: hypothetical protein M3042_06565 [Actinomycetota bacterium]|nr:hypothetical protein [Actinomycetota bacterium]